MRTLSKMVVLSASMAFATLAGAQSIPDTITFEVAPRLPVSPVYISAIQINGRNVPANQPITLTSSWPQHLAIVVTNASQKTIVSGHAEMYFPESGLKTTNNLVVARTLLVGRPPAVALYKRDGTPLTLSSEVTSAPPISVGPGKSITLDFSQVAQDALIEALNKTGTVTKITFAVGMFYFDDNSRWFPGRFGMPGASPGVWKEITADDFYLNSH
jgi:hypothetical protein